MQIGYARISRGDHDLAAQLRTLSEAGCEKVYEEGAGGADATRPQLRELLAGLHRDDVVIVRKLDCLSWSLSDLLLTLAKIDSAGAGFRSLTEAIDTTTPAGRLMMHMIGAFADFDREMIRERTMQGLETARRAGRHLGRKPKLKPSQKAEIVQMIEDGRGTPAHAAGLFNVSTATVKRVLQCHRSALANPSSHQSAMNAD